MAASKAKRKRIVKQKEQPKGRQIKRDGLSEAYYSLRPSWNFHTCDKKMWPLDEVHAKAVFWKEIFPHLQGWETTTWSSILVTNKKHNHSLDVSTLNKIAVDRLNELEIEVDSLVSLTLSGKHRLYGYIVDAVFYVLWYDDNHGDNATCVCRSHKKHT